MILILLGFLIALGWPLFVIWMTMIGPASDWNETPVFLFIASIAPALIGGSIMVAAGFAQVYDG